MKFLRGEALDERADPKWAAITSGRVTLARINYTIKKSYGEPQTPAGLGEFSTAAVIGKRVILGCEAASCAQLCFPAKQNSE